MTASPPPVFFCKSTLKQAFNRAAGSYDSAAILAQETGNRLAECLDFMRIQPENILDLGSGTGHLKPLLAQRYPVANVFALDFSEPMLLQNRKTQPQSPQQKAICADAQQLPLATRSMDLVISNLMLPWCMDLPLVFAEIHRVLKPGGLLLFSTSGVGTLAELHNCWSPVDDQPHIHPSYDLQDMGDALTQTGFADPVLDQETITLFYKTLPHLAKDLKAWGAHNLLQQRRKTLTGKNRWQGFLQHYERYRNKEGYIPASFTVIYGHAWRLEPKLRESSEVVIPITEIRRKDY